MRKIFLLILLVFPCFAFADIDEEGFILYKKPLLPGFSFNQTDSTTELIYRWKVIKSYKNEEFAIELLPHGPNEEPDCYNSLSKNLSSSRFKTLIGRDYLKDCFILHSDKIQNSYLLLYSPSIEGNRVSLYDIKKKKFYHWILNTVLSYRRDNNGGIVFLTKSTYDICNRSLVYFKDGRLTKLADSCFLGIGGIPAKIHSFRVMKNLVEITFSDVQLIENNYIPSKIERIYRVNLEKTIQPPKQETPITHSGTSLLLHTLQLP
jgi:hypothetical protein